MNEEEIINLFHVRLRKLRIEKGLNQSEASDEIGFGKNAIYHYEKDRLPRIDALIKIKNYYNVSYDYLLGATDTKNPSIEDNKKAIMEIKKILNELED